MLLEKENALLRKESSIYKQQEATITLRARELELEMKTMVATKKSLEAENEDLRQFAKKRTEEANERILKLAQSNQKMNKVLVKYQKVIEKLTNEIYLLQSAATQSISYGNLSNRQRSADRKIHPSRSTGSLTVSETSPYVNTDREGRKSVQEPISHFNGSTSSEEVSNLRQQNYKL